MIPFASLPVLLVAVVVIQSGLTGALIAPTEVHIAYTGNASTVFFSWHTTIQTHETKVHVWEDDNPLAGLFEAAGNSTSYHKAAGYFHFAVVEGLKANTKYRWSVGDILDGYSDSHHFYTQPSPSHSQKTNFIQIGDMGCENSDLTVVNMQNEVDDEDINFIVHVGDFGYGDDRSADVYEASWNYYFERLQKIMWNIPYMTCPGNHEYDCGSRQCNGYAKGFVAYNYRFNMPFEYSGAPSSMWYSWNHANIHFVAISTETDYPNAPYDTQFGNQIAWLDADLRTANEDSDIDWIIVYGHRPMYCSNNDDSTNGANGVPINQAADIQTAFEDLFLKYNVDVYFCGHVHAYERTFPISHNSVCGNNNTYSTYNSPGCPVYIINGNAGNTEGLNDGWNPDPPTWSAKRQWLDYGYGVVEIDGASQLKWSFYLNNDNGAYFDQFVLSK